MLNNTISLLRRIEAAREKRAAKGRQVMTWDAYRRIESQLRDAYKDELYQTHEAIIAAAAEMIRRAEDIEATHKAIDTALHVLQYDVMDDPPRYRTSQGIVKICHANDKRLPALRMDADILDIVRDALDDHKRRKCCSKEKPTLPPARSVAPAERRKPKKTVKGNKKNDDTRRNQSKNCK